MPGIRTAPKAGGKDFLEIVILDNPDNMKKISERMAAYAPEFTNEAFWNRDAANCAQAEAVLLVGLSKFTTAGYDCGACGFATCKAFVQARQTQDVFPTHVGVFTPLVRLPYRGCLAWRYSLQRVSNDLIMFYHFLL